MLRCAKRLAVIACWLGSACMGQVGDGRPDDPGATSSASPEGGSSRSSEAARPAATSSSNAACADVKGATPATTRIRRLTRLEYQNSIADLLGAPAAAAAGIEADTRDQGFSTGDARRVTAGYADGLQRIAGSLAADFRKTIATPRFAASCFANDTGARSCASDFVRDFGRRAYRRPLEDREVTALLAVYDGGRDTGKDGDAADRFRAGLELTVGTILQSPHFIYRSERGDLNAASGAVTQLTPAETATALAYTTVASPPDEALLKAAETGQLGTADQVGAQVRRLAAARPDRFKAQLRAFVTEWLQVDFDDPAWAKDPKAYPTFTAALKDALQQELGMGLDAWVDAGPMLDRLLVSGDGFVNKVNAPIYGMTSTATDLQKVALDPAQRTGILTGPGFLGTHARTEAGSPVLRGISVRKSLFCLQPPPVPAMVPPLPEPSKTAAKTNRERFVNHVAIPTCAACHSLFDPIGYAFEAYDALGRYRTSENGVPIDSSGAIVGTVSSDRPVASAGDLARALAASGEVHACVARQVFRFALGRAEGDYDQCPLDTATRALEGGKLDLRELLVAIATSRSFSSRIVARDP